jgi:hypothetical protein
MNSRPPAVAKWLLRHFGCGPNNAAVIGDLDERYRNGRGHAWYWRQVLDTIVQSLLSEIWRHKRLTLRALAIGWSIFFLSLYALSATYQLFSALGSWSRTWRHDWILITAQAWEVLLSGILTGWLIAKLHRQNQRTMVLAFAICFPSVHYGSLGIALLSRPVYPDNAIVFTALIALGTLIGGGIFGVPEADSTPDEYHATA